MKLSKRKPKQSRVRRLMSDDRWLAVNGARIREKYRGQAIAIWQNRVIAVGRDAVEVASKADLIAPPDEWSLLFVDHPERHV
ncbi:MAG: hypothetical protein AMXMBFR47_16340 [Planctomycetota bacterium]